MKTAGKVDLAVRRSLKRSGLGRTHLHCPMCQEAETQHLGRLTSKVRYYSLPEGSGQCRCQMVCLSCGCQFYTRSEAAWNIVRVKDPSL